jgi:hypothetical protein
MLLNALITGLPSCWATHLLSGIPAPEKNIPNLPARLFADTPDQVVVVDTGNYYPRPSATATSKRSRDGDNDKVYAMNGFWG